MFLFATVAENYPLDQNLNFTNVKFALLTMLRAATGENWQDVMHALSRSNHALYECIEQPTYEDYFKNDNKTVGCGNKAVAVAYFVSFIIIVSLIFLNLFVAVVLQGFQDTVQKSSKWVDFELIEHFREIWSLYDPYARGYIHVGCFTKLMFRLNEPLGWKDTFRKEKAW